MILKTLSIYIQPVKTIKNLKDMESLSWKFSLLVYLCALIPVIIISVLAKAVNPKEIGFLASMVYFPVFTIPGIVFYSLSGTLLFKVFPRNLINHIHYAILTVSFGITWALLFMFFVIGFIHNRAVSNNVAVIIYFGFFLLSRLWINIKLFESYKNIILKSIIESLIIFVLVFLGIGILLFYIQKHT